MSMTIQKIIIAAIYQNMIALIKEKLSAIDCFSVLMDESSDLSHKE